jgi:hypothetical protein
MKRYGKITLGLVMVIIALAMILAVHKVSAASSRATTLTFPTGTMESRSALSNPYFILYYTRTGYLINATTGVAAADVTWANAAFDEGHWTGGVVSTITGWPNFIIPAIDGSEEIGMIVCDGASPANTDTIYVSCLYDPLTGSSYTDSNNRRKGSVLTSDSNR